MRSSLIDPAWSSTRLRKEAEECRREGGRGLGIEEGRTRTVFVSYDGVLEPLGESQVLGYVERLSPAFEITLISFEKAWDLANRERVVRMRERIEAAGIRWIPLRYHKWPPTISTAFDIVCGVWVGLVRCLRRRVRLIHARGYVAAVVALALKRILGVGFLFDMRGFWADEKVESGQWSHGSVLYRATKWFERRFFESADGVVSLTREGVRAFPTLGYRIRSGIPVEVIPTCTDLERFRPGPKDPGLLSKFDLTGHVVVGCIGTMSNWYLRQPMLDYLAFLLRRIERLKVLVVTTEDHGRLRDEAESSGISLHRLILTRAEYSEMPALIRLMDVGLFFIRVCFSKTGSAATKLGEFLASGVPVIINDGVGDSGTIVRERRVGVVLPDVTPEAFEDSLGRVLQIVRDQEAARRCRAAAIDYFDLDKGIMKYETVYRTILGGRET